MKVRNILADGTEVSSVAGITIKADEFPIVYRIIERLKNNDIRRVEKSERSDTDH